MQFEHLKPETQELVNLSDEERIYAIREPLWIGYTAAQLVLKRLGVLVSYPQKDRMPNMLLVGDTNNGKTTIINHFRNKNQGFTDEETGKVNMPVFIVQVPAVPSEVRLYDTMLKKLLAPHKDRESPDKKLFQICKILGSLQTKVIILDEIHHIIAGNKRQQRQFLNAIKYLANELKIPIVGSGTQEAFNAIQTDAQLLNRFVPCILPRWKMNNEFLRLLLSFEQMIPLKNQSKLTEQTLANKILGMSEGTIGEITNIITEAAVLAVENGQEKITLKILNSIDYLTPSERLKRR